MTEEAHYLIKNNFFLNLNKLINKISPYIILLRIKSIPTTFFLAFTGYAISTNRPESFTKMIYDWLFILITVSFFIWGGTNAFNSSQDNDTGPVNFIKNPPPLPKFITEYSIIMILIGVALSSFYGKATFLLALTSFLLSIYYSWNNKFFRRGKDIIGIDMLINVLGSGFISILYGYAVTGSPINYLVIMASFGFSLALLGGIPTSQIFQINPDEVTEKKNYTLYLSAEKTLKSGALLFIAHILVILLIISDWSELLNNSLQIIFLSLWFILVVASSFHSYIWSKNPFEHAYSKMIRQLSMLMISQICWIVYIWIETN